MVLPAPSPPAEELVAGLKSFKSSSWLKRLFCSRCGASIANVEDDEWEFALGVVRKVEVDGKEVELGKTIRRTQLCVKSVEMDGGAVGWVNKGLEEGMDRFEELRRSRMVGDEEIREMLKKGKERTMEVEERKRVGGSIDAFCQCGGVKFKIVRPEDGKKFHAGLCACTSCRETSGQEITSWLTLPREVFQSEDGEEGFESVLKKLDGKLTMYSSSKGVERYFCNGCSATVFYLNDSVETIDIGVGLLDAEEGARAESRIEWATGDKAVAYPENALDPELVENLVKGINQTTE